VDGARFGLGSRLLDEAAARGSGEPPTRERALALLGAGQFAAVMGDYGAAQRHLVQALAIGRAIDASLSARPPPPPRLGGDGARPRRRGARAVRRGARRRAAAGQAAGGRRGRASRSARRTASTGTSPRPCHCTRRRSRSVRADDNAEYVAGALLNLAMSAIAREDAARARDHLREAATIAVASGSVPNGLCAVGRGRCARDDRRGSRPRAALFAGIGDAGTRERRIDARSRRRNVSSRRSSPVRARRSNRASSTRSTRAAPRSPTSGGIADVRAWLEGVASAPATSSAPSSPPDSSAIGAANVTS
jgi:hypothetical protein